jgi:D-alanyl-D-alanine carboxypeptidase
MIGVVIGLVAIGAATVALGAGKPLPADVQAVLDKPLYRGGVWGLLVVDLDTGEVVYELEPERKFLTGSVRKLFSIGLALDKLGVGHKFQTEVFRRGEVHGGVLQGDLILVASGDLAMGGRTNLDGSLAITDYDHNEANSIGNAELTKPDPLAGFDSLAQQVAAAGIREVRGDVIIDDRLFEPCNFRDEFDVRPIFVNDDVVDVMIGPDASTDWRPHSAAFGVATSVKNGATGSELEIELEPEFPKCIGAAGCEGKVAGSLPASFKPPLTGTYPLVRTFRITEPQNYARTVLIESLKKAGVKVTANAVGQNASDKLPPRDSYASEANVAELVSPPYAQYAKWILKVSYNIGADTSLVLFGLTQGARSMPASLEAEKKTLAGEFDIAADQFQFIDGSGGGDSTATPTAIVSLLRSMRTKDFFNTYRDALPILATDGSLGFVTDFMQDKSLAGAKGNVWAKTGTYMLGKEDPSGEKPYLLVLRSQALAGYIHAKSGRRLAYALFVNDVPQISGIDELLEVFQDQGTISAIIWRDN